jgi:hypothetical protein
MEPDTLSSLGWHDVSDPADDKWPIRYLGADRGIDWIVWVSPALDSPDGTPAADQIWWETDAITASEFLIVAGYARFASVDWTGQPGVRCSEEIETALDALVNDLEGTVVPAAPGGDAAVLEAVDARAARERPWLTIGHFLDEARDIRLDRPDVRDLQVKARDASLARLFVDDGVVPALRACLGRVRTPDSSLRIWVGAPNLRISLSTPVGSGTDWSEVLSEVAALGVGIAEAFGGMAASGNAGQPLVN